MKKKYYEAYDERYKIIHSDNELWFTEKITQEVVDWVNFYEIPMDNEICEVGCGEGRDAIHLGKLGYNITAIDVSETAIKKCKELSNENKVEVKWIVADALYLKENLNKQFNWVYSVATLHMLVDDEDRHLFLKSIYELLNEAGTAFILIMGDGVNERASDITEAFNLSKRNHSETGKEYQVASTSYRAVNWDNFKIELKDAGFKICRTLDTENDLYYKCMVVYLEK